VTNQIQDKISVQQKKDKRKGKKGKQLSNDLNMSKESTAYQNCCHYAMALISFSYDQSMLL